MKRQSMAYESPRCASVTPLAVRKLAHNAQAGDWIADRSKLRLPATSEENSPLCNPGRFRSPAPGRITYSDLR